MRPSPTPPIRMTTSKATTREPDEDTRAPNPPGGLTPAAAADAAKKRAELAAKAVGGLGTSLVSAIGLAKFSDVWPWPGGGGSWLALVGLLSGFAAMAVAIGGLARRLWHVNEPVIWRSNPRLIIGLRDASEKTIVRRVFDEMASVNDVPSLLAYEARGARWERISRHLSPEIAKKLGEAASVIRSEVTVTHQRANLRVVQHRIHEAFFAGGATVLYVTFFLGLLGFGLGADNLQSGRSDSIALAKACAEAKTAGAANLPPACAGASPSSPSPSPSPPTALEEVATARANLAEALAACEKAAMDEGRNPCLALRRALEETVQPTDD